MYDTNYKFKKYLKENGIKYNHVAKLLGLTPARFSLKLNEKNNAKFNLIELRTLAKAFNLDMQSIFFENFSDALATI